MCLSLCVLILLACTVGDFLSNFGRVFVFCVSDGVGGGGGGGGG